MFMFCPRNCQPPPLTKNDSGTANPVVPGAKSTGGAGGGAKGSPYKKFSERFIAGSADGFVSGTESTRSVVLTQVK